MKEKELYSLQQLVCSMGGLVLLVFGGSFMSLVELFVSMCITVVSKMLGSLLTFRPTRRMLRRAMTRERYSLVAAIQGN